MRLHRLIAIILLIESRGQIKAQDLATALETSVRTIYRDIDTLCEAGIPITATTGPNGGICLMEGYSTNLYNLHRDDAVNIYLSGIAMDKSNTGVQLKETFRKLEKILPSEYKNDLRIARERFYFDESPWWGKRLIPKCLDKVRKSIWNLLKINISYCKVNGEISNKDLLPYGLVLKDMEWYLVAFCEISNKIKTYKCDRITEVNVTNSTFQIPVGFELERYWSSNVKEFKDAKAEIEQYPVIIKLRKSISDILEKLEVFEKQEKDDYIIAKVNMHKFEFACNEVMEIIWQAEILEPIELREFIKTRIKSLETMYSLNFIN